MRTTQINSTGQGTGDAYVVRAKPSYKIGRGHMRGSIQGGRCNATQTREREQHGGRGRVRTMQQSTQQGGRRGTQIWCVHKAKLQNRKGVRTRGTIQGTKIMQTICPTCANSRTKRENQTKNTASWETQ